MMPNDSQRASRALLPGFALICLALIFLFVSVPPLPAQQKLEEKEVASLAKELAGWKKALRPRRGKPPKASTVEKAKQKFLKVFEKVQKAHGENNVLAHVDSWSEVFSIAASDDKDGKTDGKGMIKKGRKTAWQNFKGNTIAYEYAIRLPKGYSHKQSWPLIIALHDKKSTGDKYLKEAWNKNVPAELLDQFIILAPTMGEKTLGKKARDYQRLEWLNIYHLFSVFWPMREILEGYNVDTDRVYLEGVGTGGELALQLASLRGKQFAAVASRTALPRRAEFVRNLQATPIRIAARGDFWKSGDAKEARKTLEAVKKEGKVKLEIVDVDGSAPENRREPGVDPLPEVSKAFAEFFLATKRDSYPAELRFTTDNKQFYASEWIWLRRFDIESELGIFPLVDAKADREKNTITITASNVEQLRIFVNDRLLDLGKPIKVIINGDTVTEQQIERSLDYILDFNMNNPLDPRVVFAGVLQVQVPLKKEAEKEGGGKAEGAGDKGDGNKAPR